MLQCSESLAESGQHGNSIFYRNVSRVVKAFAPSDLLQDIDGEWLRRFEKWMRKNRDVTDGGISINVRTTDHYLKDFDHSVLDAADDLLF